MKQIILKKGDVVEVAWVDERNDLKEGCWVTLSDEVDCHLWEVVKIYNVSLDKQTLYKPWRVGGLE